jgi:hypothetical protein
MANIINAITTGAGGLSTTADASGSIQIATNNGTTAMTIDTSQNVLIGKTSQHLGEALNVTRSGESYIDCYSTTSGISVLTGTDPSGSAGFNGTFSNHPYVFRTNNTEQARITTAGLLQFNSGYGSVATAYGCRAWVNFNGTGTVAIRASGNVTSITDNNTGDYTVNFTTAMPDINYSYNVSPSYGSDWCIVALNRGQGTTYAPTTSSCRFTLVRYNAASYEDAAYINVAVFR